MTEYTGQTLTDALEAAGLSDWHGADESIVATYATGDFATGLEFVNWVDAAAEAANHHPDITLTYPSVEITLTSHDTGAVTDRDLKLAARISNFAAEAGITADQPQ